MVPPKSRAAGGLFRGVWMTESVKSFWIRVLLPPRCTETPGFAGTTQTSNSLNNHGPLGQSIEALPACISQVSLLSRFLAGSANEKHVPKNGGPTEGGARAFHPSAVTESLGEPALPRRSPASVDSVPSRMACSSSGFWWVSQGIH